jgi:outer membrane protein assembly factor BamB
MFSALAISLSAAYLPGAASAQITDWTTFGGSAQRTGYNATETKLSTSNVSRLTLHWSRSLGTTYSQPLVVRQVATPLGTWDAVFVVAKSGTVMALKAGNGAILWKTQLGQPKIPCTVGGAVAPGLANTPWIDLPSQLMYLVDGGGFLHALYIANGTEAAGYPVQVLDVAGVGQETEVYGSPTMVGQSLYIVTAVACGGLEDQQIYQGQVIQYDLGTQQVVHRWFPAAPLNGGGIWGPGGVSAEPDESAIYAATGNACTVGQPSNANYTEKVVKLDPNLNVLAANGPKTPHGDYDFGATPLPFQPPGCNPLLVTMDKDGQLFLHDRTKISAGPLQALQVSITTGAGDFIGIPAYDPNTNQIFLGNPNDSPDLNHTYGHGLLAFKVSSCTLQLAWHLTAGMVLSTQTANPAIPPTVANGVVYWASGIEGKLYAVDAVTGTSLWTSTQISGAILAAPTVANGRVYVAGGGRIWAFGL